jgi:hypothetical protein
MPAVLFRLYSNRLIRSLISSTVSWTMSMVGFCPPEPTNWTVVLRLFRVTNKKEHVVRVNANFDAIVVRQHNNHRCLPFYGRKKSTSPACQQAPLHRLNPTQRGDEMRLYREHSRSSSVRFADRGRPNRLHGKAQLQNSGPEARRLLETCGGLFRSTRRKHGS